MPGDLNEFEINVLRAMNGEHVPGLVGGAAMLVAARYLKGRGYAKGHYTITEQGREFLAAHRPDPGQKEGG